jgi:hypothetical protein
MKKRETNDQEIKAFLALAAGLQDDGAETFVQPGKT